MYLADTSADSSAGRALPRIKNAQKDSDGWPGSEKPTEMSLLNEHGKKQNNCVVNALVSHHCGQGSIPCVDM